MQLKQDKANDVVSKINQENQQSSINKLNEDVMSNDIVNDLFDKPIEVKRNVGRPSKSRNPIGRPIGS